MHPLIDRVLSTGITELPDGSMTKLTSAVSRRGCELIERTIDSSGACNAVEVGMAYGVSTACIAGALRGNAPKPRLVTIDPYQSEGWSSAGIHLLNRTGLRDVVELIEDHSHSALPSLLRRGARFEFALIDGAHTFDHALLDFFFIDLMLAPGGNIVFDDLGYPAVHAVVRFILANRDYELAEVISTSETASFSLRARRAIKRAVRPLVRTDRDPLPVHVPLLRRLEGAEMVAIRKRADDVRSYDHFAPF